MVVGRHRGMMGSNVIACRAGHRINGKGDIMEEAFTPLGKGLLADLVAATTPLRPFDADGDRQRGVCPFHADPTESLYVTSWVWHCFACHSGGDAVRWVMRSDGVDRNEAIVVLQRHVDFHR